MSYNLIFVVIDSLCKSRKTETNFYSPVSDFAVIGVFSDYLTAILKAKRFSTRVKFDTSKSPVSHVNLLTNDICN